MRVYLPATLTDLSAAHGLSARTGRAVTEHLRAALGEQDDEETAEFGALVLAAADSLDLLAAADAPRRVVVAAEVSPATVRPTAADEEPGQVQVPAVGWDRVVSFHVDEPTPAVTQLVQNARTGQDGARQRVEELDLLWYDATERAELIAQDTPRS